MERWKTFAGVLICWTLVSAGVSLGQTQLVSDNFTSGAAGSYLGANWTACGYNGGAYSKLVYQSNAAGGAGYYSQDCALYTGYGAFPSDQYATATVVAAAPSNIREASIELRGNATPSSPESYIACGWNAQDFPADYHYRIWSLKPNDPGATSLYLSTITPATNDVVWCQVLGSTVTMQVNGTVVATVNDTSGVNSGYPGLYYIDPNGSGPSATDVMFGNFSAGSGPPLVSVTITPNSPTVTAGSFTQFTATALFADGSTASLNNWSSSDTTITTVDNTGLAYASNAGSVTLTAAAGTDSGTTNMAVLLGQGYTPLVSDSFSGNSGFYLGSNWAGCGYDGGAYSKLMYQNNQAGGSGYYSQDCALYTGYGPFPGDQYVTAILVAPTPSSSPQTSLQLRANSTPSTAEAYIACGWDAQDFPPDYHYRIWSLKPDDPGATSLYLSSVTPAVNDVIWCQVQGTTVTLEVNGSTLASVTDTSGNMTGDTGMYFVDSTPDAPPLTDVIFDNYVAGQITGPTLTSISVNPSSAAVAPGSSQQFTATGKYTDGSTADITNSVIWSSSNPSVATVNGNGLASGASIGSATITAASGTNSGTANLTVTGAAPTVSFTGAPASASYQSAFTVTATTNASVMPTIAGSAGVCSVSAVGGTPTSASATVTMLTGTGTCTLTASWPATANYSAATLTQQTSALTIPPTVTFGGAPASAMYNSGFTVTATTNASTMPQITGTINVCTVGAVSGTPASSTAAVTMTTGTGTCTLTANWAADSNYSAATPQSQTTSATKAASSISITSFSPNPSTLQQPVSINFKASGAGAGPTGSVTVTASTNESCTGTLNRSTGTCAITFATAGSRTLTAQYAGDNNFNGSTSGSVSQTVNSPSVTLQPTSLNFGSVPVGQSKTMSTTLTNNGKGALINLSATITGSGASYFSVTGNTCGNTVNPGAHCSISVRFRPNSRSTVSATLSLSDNAANSPQSVGLSGQ